jgi:hypothetical protein
MQRCQTCVLGAFFGAFLGRFWARLKATQLAKRIVRLPSFKTSPLIMLHTILNLLLFDCVWSKLVRVKARCFVLLCVSVRSNMRAYATTTF